MVDNMYKYKNLIDRGYTKFSLTKKQHNSLFKRRQLNWFDKYDYYINENQIIMENSKNFLYIIVYTFLLPFLCLISLIKCKNIIDEYISLFNQKKLGKYSTDKVSKNTDLYDDILNTYKREQA